MSLLRCLRPLSPLLSCSPKRAGSSVALGVLMSTVQLNHPRLLLHSILHVHQRSVPVQALLDSGSEQNLIHPALVKQYNIPIESLPSPVKVTALDGRSLETITHLTLPLHLVVSGNHHENVTFFVVPTKESPIILGYPWLKEHNPHINWA